MIRSLNTGVLGIKQFQTSLDAIGNNLANINTIGFKGARVDFSDTLAQTMRAPTPDTATTSGAVAGFLDPLAALAEVDAGPDLRHGHLI